MYTDETSRPPRVALYSHDTQGLGHIRRNQAIASSMAMSDMMPDVLLVSGTRMTAKLDLPPGVDCLTLPALAKDSTGRYSARALSLPLQSLINLRAHTILAALEEFDPDVLVVDKVPYGAQDELKPALHALKQRGKTRFVLGLRDILDDPIKTREEWQRWGGDEAVCTFYDAVWIYGDPTVFNPITEYAFSADIAAKISFTGYLNRRQGRHIEHNAYLTEPKEQSIADSKLALCQVGGGQDGYPVAHAFAQAELPDHTHGLILTGPFMPSKERDQLRRIASKRSRLSVQEFTPHPGRLLHRADHVVAMGGYNTTCELLAMQKHTLLVPRVKPRLEQWIRAQRLSELGLLDVIHPDSLTAERVTEWLAHDAARTPQSRQAIDMKGLHRIPELLTKLLESLRHRAVVPKNQPI